MKPFVSNLVLAGVTALGLCASDASARTPQEQTALTNLHAASDWLIQQGISFFEENGRDALFDYLADNGPVLLWVDPQIQLNGIYALFRIHFAGYYFSIESVYQEQVDAVHYDYWMLNAFSADWASPYAQCEFLVTARELDGNRTILKRSKTFFDSYSITDDQELRVPIEDNKLLYRMKAWETPNCFPNSELPKKKICLPSAGTYVDCK